MSKNITIQEGGIAKQLTVDKLKTNLVDSGTCLWVPEDEVQLTTKNITANGTYKASDDGYYGYSEVTVSGVGSVTGTDGDGDEATVTTGDDGELVETKIPSSIRVVTPPTVTTYADGATIDFSGMVVKAYLKSGGVWSDSTHPNGIIPIGELTLPVTTADGSQAHHDEYSDGEGVNARLITYTAHTDTAEGRDDRILYLSEQLGVYERSGESFAAMFGAITGVGFMASFLATFYDGVLYVKGVQGDENLNGWYYNPDPNRGRRVYMYNVFIGSSKRTATPSGNFESRGTQQDLYYWVSGIPTSTADPTGAGTMNPEDAVQTIPVQWTRPGDYSTLKTSFDITVT